MNIINMQLLQLTKEWVLKEPATVNMSEGLVKIGDAQKEFRHAKVESPICDTVGCIAGTGVLISKRLIGQNFEQILEGIPSSLWYIFVLEEAIKVFGLTRFTADQLFYVKNWPVDLQVKLYKHEPGTLGYAQVVAERIDRFTKQYADA